jgi:lipopolysaccharide biosynthesis glycosyltransferase
MEMSRPLRSDLEMSVTAFPVYVGYDRREDAAYQVCRHSLSRNTSVPLDIRPLIQDELRAKGLYTRGVDPLASTDFTYTRFFVPYLAGYRGWAIFCDCDFLWLSNISDLLALADERYAAMCVHHDHRPTEKSKMDGQQQTLYPRKNWSSMILFNCGHPANQALTPDLANTETGKYLHRFGWLDDSLIGELPQTWNWLEGWNEIPENGTPSAIHYTRGGPWFEDWKDVDYAEHWLREERAYLAKT